MLAHCAGSLYVTCRWWKCSAFEMFGVFGNSRVPVTVRTYLIEKSGMGIQCKWWISLQLLNCRKRLHQEATRDQWTVEFYYLSVHLSLIVAFDPISFLPSLNSTLSLSVHSSLVASWRKIFLTWFELYSPFLIAAYICDGFLYCSTVPFCVLILFFALLICLSFFGCYWDIQLNLGGALQGSIWACVERYWLWIRLKYNVCTYTCSTVSRHFGAETKNILTLALKN